MSLSVVLITLNEAARIERCLASLAWADEIIVVDSGSTDGTLELCTRHGAQVFSTADWLGFGPQKNRALAHARSDWVLSIDADEWLSPQLTDEIRAAMGRSAAAVAYRMPRRSRYLGRVMRHGGWWPDYVVRLFRRGQGRFSDDRIHERVVVDGPVATLIEPLEHEAFVDLEQVLNKVNRYSTLGAETLVERGRRASLFSAIAHGLWAFIRTYIVQAGFLDGQAGFMLAVSNAEGTYYRYAKCALAQHRPWT
ncbi:MAG: glycosyltransferase family 2 protein [Acidiferrobacteraceae bacterium]